MGRNSALQREIQMVDTETLDRNGYQQREGLRRAEAVVEAVLRISEGAMAVCTGLRHAVAEVKTAQFKQPWFGAFY
jgi:hypothetical protein